MLPLPSDMRARSLAAASAALADRLRAAGLAPATAGPLLSLADQIGQTARALADDLAPSACRTHLEDAPEATGNVIVFPRRRR